MLLNLFYCMNQDKLISIIIPVFNTGKYLKEAIDSVFFQTYKNFEIICINDCSTDNSLKILSLYKDKITIINNDVNMGASYSRNVGIKASLGDFIAFLDADDLWDKSKLEKQMTFFKEDKDLDICFTLMKSFISPDLSQDSKNLKYCPKENQPAHIPSSCIIKKSSFLKVGFLDEKYKNADFVDWLNRAKENKLKILTIDEVLISRRIHETNISISNKSIVHSEYIKTIRESLKRKKE